MGKAKEIRLDSLVKVNPITDNQKKAFEPYEKGKNFFMYGAAGKGKPFIKLYLSMSSEDRRIGKTGRSRWLPNH